jgi:diguanylate cyclase (GGDEF)-like protein/hemerythrin-like metal-binding protein
MVDLRSLGAHLLNSGIVAVAVVRKGKIEFANPAFHQQFRASGSLVGFRVQDLVADAEKDRLTQALVAAERSLTTYVGVGKRSDTHSFDLELELECTLLEGASTIIALASDITDLHRLTEQLSYLAYTDALTGAANRAQFADRLHRAIISSRRSGAEIAVLIADLDGFKMINDTLGHDAGDMVLQLVTQCFQSCIRDCDTLARLGGDEFAVLLPELHSAATAELVGQRMIDALARPLCLGTSTVSLGVSVGIADYPRHANSADTLLVAADTALYRAKRAGKSQFHWAVGHGSSSEPLCQNPVMWTAAHSVGVDEIDNQHVQLANLIDILSVALRDGVDHQDILTQLEAVIEYTEYHFAAEERLMTEYQVDDNMMHREAHRRLLDDIRKLDVTNDWVSISLILRYLREWLLRHVDSFDKRLAVALLKKGYMSKA